jgi:hypothetical protein
MRVSRALPLALALAVMPLWQAAAQFGGGPGMSGAPAMSPVPGMSPAAPGASFAAPQQPPPGCQQLLTSRDDVAKNGQALQAAGQRKAPPDEICKLFKAFLAAESKMIKGLQEHSATCGVPSEVLKQVQDGHGKASEVGKKICDAAQAPRPAAPSLSDALGAGPMVPDASAATKKGQSTFDTLTGSPLTR